MVGAEAEVENLHDLDSHLIQRPVVQRVLGRTAAFCVVWIVGHVNDPSVDIPILRVQSDFSF